MRQTQFSRVIILSAELSELGYHENRLRDSNLRQCLEDIGITPHRGIGCYQNGLETSCITFPKNALEADAVTKLALIQFNQESVLYRGMNGTASLFFANGTTKELGTLDETSMKLARRHENYTVFNDKYYVTKGCYNAE